MHKKGDRIPSLKAAYGLRQLREVFPWTRQLQNLVKAAASSMPPYQNCTYFRETGRAVSMKPPMPRQVLQLPPWTITIYYRSI